MVIALTLRDYYYRRYEGTDRVCRAQRQSRHSNKKQKNSIVVKYAKEARSNGVLHAQIFA